MPDFQFDPKKHVYTLDGSPMMGVTTVLGIISKQLSDWASRVGVAKAFTLAQEMSDVSLGQLAGRIAEYPANIGKGEADQLASEFPEFKEARKAYLTSRDKAADKGTDVHALCETYINDCINTAAGIAVKADHADPMVQKFIDWAVSNSVTFLASEKRLYSKTWFVAGTCDLIFKMGDKVFVGDIKTHKVLWDRVPFIQTAAYSKMLLELEHYPEIQGTCVLTIPKDGGEFSADWSYDLDGDIFLFEAALRLYKGVPLTK